MYVSNWVPANLSTETDEATDSGLRRPLLAFVAVVLLAAACVVGLDAMGRTVPCSVADATPACCPTC